MTNERQFRVAEIFGPTIQGEGRNVGIPCHFVRFGGCDFRCSWCDTPHAVLPKMVNKLPKMNEWGILAELNALGGCSPEWIVITGGNPALLVLDKLIDLLHERRQKVMVETQGSVFREWFGKVDDLCFSPKPPSSGMDWDFKLFDRILARTFESQAEWNSVGERTVQLPYLKVPVFSDEDLEFAAAVNQLWGSLLEVFISIGNDDPGLPTVGDPNPRDISGVVSTSDHILRNQRAWTERILQDQRFYDCRIFSQQHVLLWGNARGH